MIAITKPTAGYSGVVYIDLSAAGLEKIVMLSSVVNFTDVLSKGVWQTIEVLQDPDLKRLAKCLPDTLLQGKANSTTTKYVRGFMKWKAWAGQGSEAKFSQ